MFHREHSECFADTYDQCKHGRILIILGLLYVNGLQKLCFLMYSSFQVLCDRHYGGINYPIGGVGGIAKSLVKGLLDKGSNIIYKANVTNIILEDGKAVSGSTLYN